MCQASFTIVSAQSNMISMVFDAGQQPLTTEVVLSQFLPGTYFTSPIIGNVLMISQAPISFRFPQAFHSLPELAFCVHRSALK
jgi:hypothetical protein